MSFIVVDSVIRMYKWNDFDAEHDVVVDSKASDSSSANCEYDVCASAGPYTGSLLI
jgi:hypothetical protein